MDGRLAGEAAAPSRPRGAGGPHRAQAQVGRGRLPSAGGRGHWALASPACPVPRPCRAPVPSGGGITPREFAVLAPALPGASESFRQAPLSSSEGSALPGPARPCPALPTQGPQRHPAAGPAGWPWILGDSGSLGHTPCRPEGIGRRSSHRPGSPRHGHPGRARGSAVCLLGPPATHSVAPHGWALPPRPSGRERGGQGARAGVAGAGRTLSCSITQA